VSPVASVLAVDDEPRMRSALRCLVEATWRSAIVDEAESGEAAVARVQELEPDVVLMDVRMPGVGGIAATETIKRIRPETLVLLVSSTHPDELPRAARECHADAILWKSRLRPQALNEVWARHAKRTDSC
jgi:DNA-binding NarL/FixJ family response regulator